MLRFFKSRTNLGAFLKSQFDYKKIRNGEKSRFLYRFLKTNNTPIELLWFRFGVLFILEATPGFEPGDKGFADLCLTTWLCRLIVSRSILLKEAQTTFILSADLSVSILTKTRARQSLAYPSFWSGLRGSNPPPRPWQGRALPNELNPHYVVPPVGIEPTTRGFSVPCSTN